MSKNQIPTITLRMTQREYDTILAALRHWQKDRNRIELYGKDEANCSQGMEFGQWKIASDHGEPLSLDEIDQLILRVQFDDKPEPLRRRYFAMVPSWSETKARTIDVIGGSEKDSAGMDAALKAAHKALGKSVHVKLIPVGDTKPNITVKV